MVKKENQHIKNMNYYINLGFNYIFIFNAIYTDDEKI